MIVGGKTIFQIFSDWLADRSRTGIMLLGSERGGLEGYTTSRNTTRHHRSFLNGKCRLCDRRYLLMILSRMAAQLTSLHPFDTFRHSLYMTPSMTKGMQRMEQVTKFRTIGPTTYLLPHSGGHAGLRGPGRAARQSDHRSLGGRGVALQAAHALRQHTRKSRLSHDAIARTGRIYFNLTSRAQRAPWILRREERAGRWMVCSPWASRPCPRARPQGRARRGEAPAFLSCRVRSVQSWAAMTCSGRYRGGERAGPLLPAGRLHRATCDGTVGYTGKYSSWAMRWASSAIRWLRRKLERRGF